jgi:hypothetical protein
MGWGVSVTPPPHLHHHHHHWHNSPFWAKAFFRSFRQLFLFLAEFLQFLSSNFLTSSITPWANSQVLISFHRSSHFGQPGHRFFRFRNNVVFRSRLSALRPAYRLDCFLVWAFIMDHSGMGGPTSSYATASISPSCRNLPMGKTRYQFYRRLVGPQGRSGQVRKISPPPGFDPGPSSP